MISKWLSVDVFVGTSDFTGILERFYSDFWENEKSWRTSIFQFFQGFLENHLCLWRPLTYFRDFFYISQESIAGSLEFLLLTHTSITIRVVYCITLSKPQSCLYVHTFKVNWSEASLSQRVGLASCRRRRRITSYK